LRCRFHERMVEALSFREALGYVDGDRGAEDGDAL
jgi:hypothetical protein